jgi:hypothetical protein
MSEQTPSVGRVVHYVSLGSADGKYPSVCRAAVITEVVFSAMTSPGVQTKSDIVGLAVLNPSGLFFDRAIAYDDQFGTPGTWHWPERV